MLKKAPYTPKKGLNLVGVAVRRIRRNSRPRVTLLDLSARLEVLGVRLSESMLSKVEGGERGVADYEVIALAHALKVPIEELYA
jgi:HTH-type transcriptional regulator, cell division transcriptional repressor